MINTIKIILCCLAIICNIAEIIFLLQALKGLNEIDKILKKPALGSAPTPAKKEPEAPDDKASNAERLFQEGIQSILSYDVDTMKKHLRGVDDA